MNRLIEIQNTLPAGHGVEWYIVGGAVRDWLSGKTPQDFDLVVRGPEISPQWMLEKGFKMIDPKSTIMVFSKEIPGIGKIEVAFPRREKKTCVGHRGFEFEYDPLMKIEDDLIRRDFTINSMAVNVHTGELIDPFGGKYDLAKGRLKHTSNHFVEDPLRVFRAYRFTAMGFSIDPETAKICNEIDLVIPEERIWHEIEKAMTYPYPWRFFESWVKTGAGLDFFYGLRESLNIPAGKGKHDGENLFTHSLNTLKAACKLTEDPAIRLAAFLHDWGKLTTPADLWPSHYNHDLKGPEIVKLALKQLKAPKLFVNTACAVSRWHMIYQNASILKESTLIRSITTNLKYHIPTFIVAKCDGGIDTLAEARLGWAYEIASAPARALIPESKLKEKQHLKEKIGDVILNSKVTFMRTLLTPVLTPGRRR